MIRLQNTKNLDNFYVQVCRTIDQYLFTHNLLEINNLCVTKSKHPIIGLHSTTESSLHSILDVGFNTELGDLTEINDRPEALFASPYINWEQIENTRLNRRYTSDYISFSNGFNRVIKYGIFNFFDKYGVNIEKLKDQSNGMYENDVKIPMIIAAFSNSSDKRITFDNSWINSFDAKKQVKILGVLYVYFTHEQVIDLYHSYKSRNYDPFVYEFPLNFSITWVDDYQQNYTIIN